MNDAEFLGRLDYLVSRHNIEVNPIIFSINKELQFVPNEEIEAVFTVPISFLINKKRIFRKILLKNMENVGLYLSGSTKISRFGDLQL